MADRPIAPDPKSPVTLTDDQIVTAKRNSRRSFLSSSGALLAGAAALATGTGVRALAADDPKPPESDKRYDRDRRPPDRDKHQDAADRDQLPPDRDRDRDRKPHDPATP